MVFWNNNSVSRQTPFCDNDLVKLLISRGSTVRSFFLSLPILALLAAPAPGEESVLTDEVVYRALAAAIVKVDHPVCAQKKCTAVWKNEISPPALSESRAIMEIGIIKGIAERCGKDWNTDAYIKSWQRTKNQRQMDIAEVLLQSGKDMMAKRQCTPELIEELRQRVDQNLDALNKEIDSLQKKLDFLRKQLPPPRPLKIAS